MPERVMRIMQPDSDWRLKAKPVRVDSLPWGMFCEVAARQTQANHGQTLDRLSERGGLTAPEAVCILICRHWAEGLLDDDTAHRVLYTMRSLYRREPAATE
jgi:hypothetical protein